MAEVPAAPAAPAAPSGASTPAPHVPVLLAPLLAAVAPVAGTWIDGTFGAGGYTQGLLAAGAARVIAIDRDPTALALADSWAGAWGDRLVRVESTFSEMDRIAAAEGGPVEGVVLDLGVSSMQIDQAGRGFSFQKDGPLDMRMGADGPTAADLVNGASEAYLADILYHYGEERAARRIARAIVAARPITTTLGLVAVIERCLPRPKPGQSHPATRSFQALRIAVNDEFGQLADGLAAAERALAPGGLLAVVTFHSLEDRAVKRFLSIRSGGEGQGSRHAPARAGAAPTFTAVTRRAVGPDEAELAVNPRARSAKLRVARRTEAAPRAGGADALGLVTLAPPAAARRH